MQVHNIQSTSFQGKTRRFVTPEVKEGIRELLTKMNSETDYKTNKYVFKSEFTKSLKYGDKAEFIDGRLYLTKFPKSEQMQKETLFTIGKTQLVIDNKTGEIIKFVKPFFTTWKKIMKNVDEYVNLFKQNYDNSNVITKKRLSMQGFTEEGQMLLKW